jgi:Fe-Mn family superoxide dismutase
VAGGIPILALDMYEHAYHMTSAPTARAYVDTFMRNLDWKALLRALRGRSEGGRSAAAGAAGVRRSCRAVGVEEVKAMLDAGKPVQVIDARPRHFVSRQQVLMAGATWRDPERVQEWVGELSKSDPVVVFCAYGFHIGCKTAIKLRDLGCRREVHARRPFRMACHWRPDKDARLTIES